MAAFSEGEREIVCVCCACTTIRSHRRAHNRTLIEPASFTSTPRTAEHEAVHNDTSPLSDPNSKWYGSASSKTARETQADVTHMPTASCTTTSCSVAINKMYTAKTHTTNTTNKAPTNHTRAHTYTHTLSSAKFFLLDAVKKDTLPVSVMPTSSTASDSTVADATTVSGNTSNVTNANGTATLETQPTNFCFAKR